MSDDSTSLANFSVQEINKSRELFKRALVFYSTNVKSYAKWFEISEVEKNEETFTSYKVVYRFLPKDLNESIKELIVWKRFRDFKELNQFMSNYHSSLHRRDKFPEFVKSKFFGRFDDKVIEERRQYSLHLLQFIGSQAHLYKHEKFIDFLSSDGAYFTDHQTSELNTGRVLQPMTTTNKNSSMEGGGNGLDQLISEISSFIEKNTMSPNSYDYLIDNLVKTKKLLTLSAQNKNNSVSFKYLKSALSNLSDFMSEMEANNTMTSKSKDAERNSFLKYIYKRINSLMDQSLEIVISPKSLEGVLTPPSATAVTPLQPQSQPPPLGKTPETTFLNDWILSDFNLVSNDFNNELSFISGNLFDLSFNYKLVKLLNENCFLMRLRHQTTNNATDSINDELYLLKRLQKSFNPTLTTKSLVPFKNRIPFMCQLIKYYESDNTIFLLIDYHKFGPLFSHLRLIHDDIQSFPHNLTQIHSSTISGHKGSMSSSITTGQPKTSLTDASGIVSLRLSQSFSGFPTQLEHAPKSPISSDAIALDKRRTQSHSQSIKLKLVEITDTTENMNAMNTIFSTPSLSPSSDSGADAPNSSSSSSSSSEEASLSPSSSQPKVEFSSPSRVLFKTQAPLEEEKPPSPKPEVNKTTLEYQKQVKVWLAQLLCALRNLHEMGIIRKDLMVDDLLLAKNGNLVLTYVSKWNLVDERVKKQSIKEFYAAPELSGMVNNPIGEACDWWSFGVIAYEIISMHKFSELHQRYELYVNKINFPSDFCSDTGKDLVKKLLKLNPSERLSREQIQNHPYFSGTDWIQLEESFWKSK